MAATATVQSRSKSFLAMPMPSFKGASARSIRSFTQRAASPAPSSSSRRRDESPAPPVRSESPSPFYAASSKDAAGSSSSIKSGKSLTGSLLSIRSLGKIASFGARLGARARPAHPPPETFTYLKDLVLVDEPEDMDMDMDLRCGGEEHEPLEVREIQSGSEAKRGAFWGKPTSDDDADAGRQGLFSPSMLVQNRPIPAASRSSPNFSSPPHDDDHPHPTTDDMPTRTHTLPAGAAAPAPTAIQSRTENGNMNTFSSLSLSSHFPLSSYHPPRLPLCLHLPTSVPAYIVHQCRLSHPIHAIHIILVLLVPRLASPGPARLTAGPSQSYPATRHFPIPSHCIAYLCPSIIHI
ncbi:hypothetical protein D9619_004149 [Psilocybe cf. subviscida]|uniref:Uncharacterized protein n=1 Tax=Psilocybe cf. subviscida TaxID=2480587 RepID=A0A8H5F7T6_9AGAR|nr:hypothetical protein D9619_004149 [Psilocybe cf. subviscida]